MMGGLTMAKQITRPAAPQPFVVTWRSKTCGRCGGSGAYHVGTFVDGAGGVGARVCWSCRGQRRVMHPTTQRNRDAFRAWKQERPRTWGETLDALESGRFGSAFTVTFGSRSTQGDA